MKTEKECRNYLKTIEKALDDMVDKSIGAINVTYLSRKEKAAVTNKRNCLITQQYMLKWFLDEEEEMIE